MNKSNQKYYAEQKSMEKYLNEVINGNGIEELLDENLFLSASEFQLMNNDDVQEEIDKMVSSYIAAGKEMTEGLLSMAFDEDKYDAGKIFSASSQIKEICQQIIDINESYDSDYTHDTAVSAASYLTTNGLNCAFIAETLANNPETGLDVSSLETVFKMKNWFENSAEQCYQTNLEIESMSGCGYLDEEYAYRSEMFGVVSGINSVYDFGKAAKEIEKKYEVGKDEIEPEEEH